MRRTVTTVRHWRLPPVSLFPCDPRARGRTCRSGPGGYGCRLLQLSGDGLDLGVGMERLVAHLAAPAGLLIPAERQCRVEHVVAVDPDGAGPELLGQGVGLGDVLGPDACPQAILGVVRY